MLTQKYNYTQLSRDTDKDGKRHYCLPDGSQVPSVTTILDKTKPKEKQEALANWRKRVGTDKAKQITTEAANRGTRMHKYLEDHINGIQLKDTVSNPFAQQSLTMAKTVIANGLVHVNEVWGTEVPLYFPKIYAGTTDCVGIHNNCESILDFKQTNKPKKREWIEDYFLQLAAYAEAHNEVHGTKICKGVILMCVQPPEIQPGVWGEPQYLEFISEGVEFNMWRDLWWQRVESYYKMI